ncbi:expressed protein [Batrachochytrium dendrobatidis JAM81]|uniref:Expressed protein n=1 Tax=Batrachochytrium dendrobatidis (strain JAM81 / FGSC 10211) TaxID=684364 RepID=F4P7V4_BATDJ|nr:uncharacterized protein BATDEDRAFT_90479 [Batrachochytrium dendrobatidis JAM81]EGF78537.1 expressed protein [Batrachochytrium dendrobatidis JAM81]|eukprot:XP_006680877.1 expressed protein [Batrachochytrium dendrobatidis JAM81]
MSTPTEIATALQQATEDLRRARESLERAEEDLRRERESLERAEKSLERAEKDLKRAEKDLRNWRAANPTDFTNAGYLALSAEVTRCTVREERVRQTLEGAQQILAGAHQTLASAHQTFQQVLAVQKAIFSPQSSVTSISCKSQSINGRCSTGRHTDRNKKAQQIFREKLLKRDIHCIATKVAEGFVAAHIVPLNMSELIARSMLFSPRNGVLLREDLEDDYDRHKWIFDYNGKVTSLFSNWDYKDIICHVNVSNDPETGPSKELIELHNKLALERAQHHCPNCWKYVGAINIDNHTAKSCEGTNKTGDEKDVKKDI